MAAVYAVRRKGLEGFDKLLALKVLLPNLAASDQRFVEMFIDEARIAAQLQHPNLAQVFDSGRQGDLNYLVMELLRGKALSHVARRNAERGRALPVPVISAVIAASADGLHAAHETT